MTMEEEIANLKNDLINANVEKMALDSSYGEMIKSYHQLKMKNIFNESTIQQLAVEVGRLTAELEKSKEANTKLEDELKSGNAGCISVASEVAQAA